MAGCSLEEDDGGEARITNIIDIISECRYAIHDISRTEPDESGLPRFNMPLELGTFLGARRFGDKDQQSKKFLILDKEDYRYQQFISDLAGYDIRSHGNTTEKASAIVRDWLVVASRRKLIPDKGVIWGRYMEFQHRLARYCDEILDEDTDQRGAMQCAFQATLTERMDAVVSILPEKK